jgi:hypothetical protein
MGRDQGPSGLGRLLGGFVVVGALLLMGAATFMFLGGSRPTPPVTSPSPTAIGIASPTPEATPTLPATPVPALPTPTPLATPDITLPPTPEPSPVQVEVREGPGYVTFGSGWTRGLVLQDVSATFTPGGRLAWSAVLTEPAGAPALDVVLGRIDPATGEVEQVTWEERYEMQNQSSERILRRLPINRITDGPGIYVMRYLRNGELLSEGYFELVAQE